MPELKIRILKTQEYALTYDNMREFTTSRNSTTADEFWCLQHPAVFTLGANADTQNILQKTDIPIIQSDRGGQVTYHGPGQIIIYCLIDLRRKGIGVKQLVQNIENSVVSLLSKYQIESEARSQAHGVYIENTKVASLGLRVSGGCSYHGVALNVDMDLTPFTYINPCGFAGLAVTQLSEHGVHDNCNQIHKELAVCLYQYLDYSDSEVTMIE